MNFLETVDRAKECTIGIREKINKNKKKAKVMGLVGFSVVGVFISPNVHECNWQTTGEMNCANNERKEMYKEGGESGGIR